MYSIIDEIKAFMEAETLPGVELQAKFRPYQKLLDTIDFNEVTPRQSAVCLLLFPDQGKWNNVLIQRPSYKGVHSAQIAFPGGKAEESDSSLWHTAKRETWEEIGVEMDHIQMVHKMTNVYIPPSNFMVNPYIGFMDHKPNFIPDEREVDEIITYSIDELLRTNLIKARAIEYADKRNIHTTYLDIENKVVWGATAMMLMEFRAILKAIKG